MSDPVATLEDCLRSQRLSLIELLEELPVDEWSTPSLCAGWSVQDVAAHLAWAPVTGPGAGLLGSARAGFRVNRFIGDSARRWAARGRAAILAQLRENAASGAKAFGVPAPGALTDALVHGLDIRCPLGARQQVPAADFHHVADWLAGARWPTTVPIGGSVRRRVAGVRLVAEGADWSHGEGPEARGTTDSVLLLLTGRAVGPDELTGPGAPLVYGRQRAG